MAHMLVTSAAYLAGHQQGSKTLVSLLQVVPDDPLGRTMARDLACAAAKALESGIGPTVECDSGRRLLRELLTVLVGHGEREWVTTVVDGEPFICGF